ncbi:MAG: hypothetical protein D6715_13280 [Calditrichaeota bacterium]|nr:MAG: hypothetical protein D6715_13280 [Calditrichota bacterium]
MYRISLLLEQGEYAGHLYHFSLDLTPQQVENFRTVHREILRLLEQFKSTFQLKGSVQRASQTIHGTGHYFYALLADETAESLRRYGRVDPSLAGQLDPMIDQLMEQVKHLIYALQGDPDERRE